MPQAGRWSHERINYASWRKQRVRVLARDSYRCQLRLPGCTLKADQVDHLVPWVPGTVVHDSQLQAACAHCNRTAGPPERRNPAVPKPGWLG